MKPRDLIAPAVRRLASAGVESPQVDAQSLLAHVLGVDRMRVNLVDYVEAADAARFEGLIARRATREPLQHLTGSTRFAGVDLLVGPGVFVPRPETEHLAAWAIERCREVEAPVVVDLCTGSGALAKAIATAVPEARVHAIELDPAAHAWAERNLAGTDVDLRLGDAFDSFAELDGTVDLVVANPPYIPLTAWESVAPEARDHDPHLALFSGDDGLDAIRALERTAARLLEPGGVVGVEHADAQGESAPAVFAARWLQVRDHTDLAGRPRFVTARRP